MIQLNNLLAFIILAVGINTNVIADNEQKFPDVLSVSVRPGQGNTFDFDVTISSPYDSEKRYADGFQVTGDDDKVYGERVLWHDHASEQPFTRDLYGVKIPHTVRKVVIQARDQKYGYGGNSVEIALPGR